MRVKRYDWGTVLVYIDGKIFSYNRKAESIYMREA